MRRHPRRLVGQQQFEHHAARGLRPFVLDVDLHALSRLAQAGSLQHALALDFDHAGAAIAVRPVTRFGGIAKMRDSEAGAVGDLPDRFVGGRLDRLAVDREAN
jgi:hypothetical protein